MTDRMTMRRVFLFLLVATAGACSAGPAPEAVPPATTATTTTTVDPEVARFLAGARDLAALEACLRIRHPACSAS